MPPAKNQFFLGALCYCLAASGCSSSVQVGPQAAAIASARVQSQTNPYRPKLTLVERDGDPSRGLAMAVHVAAAPAAVAMLSWLVEGRLRGAGFDRLSTQNSASGFVVYALAEEEEQIARFIRDGNRALLTPVSATEVHDTIRVSRFGIVVAHFEETIRKLD